MDVGFVHQNMKEKQRPRVLASLADAIQEVGQPQPSCQGDGGSERCKDKLIRFPPMPVGANVKDIVYQQISYN
jgi:hypothetical protein